MHGKKIIKKMVRKKVVRKKAVLFTLISLLLAAMFVALFSAQYQYNPDDRSQASNTRVKVLDTYVRNFELYVEESLQISGYKTLDSLYNYSVGRNMFFNNSAEFNTTFANCITCGYMNCTNRTVSCPDPLKGYDLSSMLSNISSLANQHLNIVTDYRINSVVVYQVRPFDVEIDLNISYNVSDIVSTNYAIWNKNLLIHKTILITDLYDPLVAINTHNAYRKIIRPTSICTDAKVNDTCWDLNKTRAFYNSQEYKQYTNGTNYLARFWNGTGPSGYSGIESLLNVSYMTGNNSFVDTYYWTRTYVCPPGTTRILQINSTALNFLLDEGTAARYNITNAATLICPPLPTS